MIRALTLIAFALGCGISPSAAQGESNAVETLIKQGIMEEVGVTNSVTNVISAVQGTLVKAYLGKFSEGFKLYVKFESPLSEKEVANQFKQDALWVEADGLRYDTNAPHFPGVCDVPNLNDANKSFREFVATTLKNCKRYYSLSGRHRRWITLYVEENESGKRTYHLFHGFTFD